MTAPGLAPAPAIGTLRAATLYARMTWRRRSRLRQWAGAATIALLPACIAALGAWKGRWGAGWFDDAIELYLRFLLPLAPVMAVAQAVAEEIEGRTYTYLWVRPAPRAGLILGKWAITTLSLLPSFVVGVALTYAIALAPDPAGLASQLPQLARMTGAIALGVPIYTALAIGVGTLIVRRPLIAAFLYILVIEELFGSLPGAIKVLALGFYVREIAGSSLGATPGIWEPRPGPVLATVLALALGGGWLALASWLVRDAEYRDRQ